MILYFKGHQVYTFASKVDTKPYISKSGTHFYAKYKTVGMKKNSTVNFTVNKAQKGKELKKGLPVKNAMTDANKNAATQTPGLNQVKTSRDDLFPSDGDNLTN